MIMWNPFTSCFILQLKGTPCFYARSQNCEKRLSALSCASVRLSVCARGVTRLPLVDFHEIWYLTMFRKSVEKIQFSLKSDKNEGFFIWYLAQFFLERKTFHTKRVENNTHFMFNNILFSKIGQFMRQYGKIS